MARLEHLHGVIPNEAVQVIDVEWYGSDAVTLVYRDQRENTACLAFARSGTTRRRRLWLTADGTSLP